MSTLFGRFTRRQTRRTRLGDGELVLRDFIPTGLKRQYNVVDDPHSGLTAFSAKALRRRRAKNKMAHESRRRNR